MHLLAISLLTILAGTLLLAKFKKDMSGKIFSCIAWFFIIVGFVLFIGFIGGGIVRIAHHGFTCHPDQQEMMMKDFHHGMPGGFCCPKEMDKGKCCEKPGCKMHDSLMKCCAKPMVMDTVKMPMKKK